MSDLYLSIILITGVAQGILLSFVLLTLKRGNRRANRILAAVILVFTLMLLPHASVYVPGEKKGDSWGAYYIHMLFFLLPPLIYYYAKYLIDINFRLRTKNLIHLMPFIIFLLLLISLRLFNASESLLKVTGILMTVLIVVQVSMYLFPATKLLASHRERIKLSYSYLEKISLNWLRFLLWGQMVIWLLFLLAEMINFEPRDYFWIPLALFIYLMGYLGLVQPEIFSGPGLHDARDQDDTRKKYAKSALTPEMADEYYCRLIRLMENDKPYLKNDLTLQSLAGMLSVSSHHLSQVINEKAGKNFFDFVNSYRIGQSKALLMDPSKNYLSVAAIGFESGFNSVTSFNTTFRKLTNTTPSQFRKASEK